MFAVFDTGRRLTGAVLLASVALTTGCASLPQPDVLNALPVVGWEQAKPAQGDYIVHLKSSDTLSTEARVQGNLFRQSDQQTLKVQLKHDLYLYKDWVSDDKVTWRHRQGAISGQMKVNLPSYERPSAGEIVIEMNEK